MLTVLRRHIEVGVDIHTVGLGTLEGDGLALDYIHAYTLHRLLEVLEVGAVALITLGSVEVEDIDNSPLSKLHYQGGSRVLQQ